jgi:putative oxidoreductase
MSRAACWLIPALRIGLGALFVYAAWHKILLPGAFAHEIHNYKILPVPLVNPSAIIVPWLELFCGVALILNRWARGASALVALMMVVFTAAVASTVARGLNIACGCFNTGGSPATWLTVARDAGFALAAIVVWLETTGKTRWTCRT